MHLIRVKQLFGSMELLSVDLLNHVIPVSQPLLPVLAILGRKSKAREMEAQ